MGWHFMRNLFVVLGVYWLAEWFAQLVSYGEGLIGVVYGGGVGRIGELWLCVQMNASRAFAAAGATALLWFTLGDKATRRWIWGLAALFAVLGLASRQFIPAPGGVPDSVSRLIDVAVYSLLPAVGCVAAVWLLGRYAPVAGQPAAAEDIAMRGRSRALMIAWSALMLGAGAFIGMGMYFAVEMQGMAGRDAAVLEHGWRSQHALTQYREADYDEAKGALEQFAAYLELLRPASPEWQPGEAPHLDDKGLALDRMLTYGRLALRAERADKADEAAGYWLRAEQQARTLGWEVPTSERIRGAVTRVDAEHAGRSLSELDGSR